MTTVTHRQLRRSEMIVGMNEEKRQNPKECQGLVKNISSLRD